MRRLFTLLSAILLLSLLSLRAQQPYSVGGIVVSSTTGRPLQGASIAGGGQAVVTNDDGRFLLKSDTLLTHIVVSHVGYGTQQVSTGSGADGQLRIRLRPTAIQLSEVLVRGVADPRLLVEAAINRIPENYSTRPELYHCFYRETAQKRDRYIMVAEGVVDMYKAGVRYGGSGIGRDRVAIRKGRRLLSPRQGDTLSVKVTGGPVGPVQLDIVKNLDFLLNKEELNCYELKMEAPTNIGERQQYVVSLMPRVVMPYALYHGRLYIDQETLAITRAELTLDMSDRDKATQLMLVKKPAGVRFRPKELSLLVDYRRGSDGLTRLSYVRTLFRFNCDWRRRLFATSFTACCEMVVTSTTADARPISGSQSFDSRDAFFDKVDFFRDPHFWEDYNIIEPTESLDRAIDRLLKRF